MRIKYIIYVIIFIFIAILINKNYDVIKANAINIYSKYFQKEVKQTLISNEYRKKQNYEYLKIYENSIVKNSEDLKNAIYTFLDAGWEKYTIKCDIKYLTCQTDAKDYVENEDFLTNISNFVHPYNSFNNFNTSIKSNGEITFKKTNKYNEKEIELINNKINEIYEKNYDPNKNVIENIKIFHDYIINNTKYDSSIGLNDLNHPSTNAYGVLFNNKGVCSGYSDTISLLLEKMNVKNYKISSSSHIWNLVYIEGDWKHLDLTWDDPVTNIGIDKLTHDYFLINTKDLLNKDDKEHNFDTNIYKESNL